MLKLKLQYFSYLMQRADLFEKTLMLAKIEDKRRRGRQRNAAAAAKSLQSCPTLCDPIDGSPSSSPIPEILQSRTLEWVAISFSNACK